MPPPSPGAGCATLRLGCGAGFAIPSQQRNSHGEVALVGDVLSLTYVQNKHKNKKKNQDNSKSDKTKTTSETKQQKTNKHKTKENLSPITIPTLTNHSPAMVMLTPVMLMNCF